MNTIYNQAGIIVEVVDKGYKNFNFDINSLEDNKISLQEQLRLHWAFTGYQSEYGDNMQKSENTIIWRVHDIQAITSGLSRKMFLYCTKWHDYVLNTLIVLNY